MSAGGLYLYLHKWIISLSCKQVSPYIAAPWRGGEDTILHRWSYLRIPSMGQLSREWCPTVAVQLRAGEDTIYLPHGDRILPCRDTGQPQNENRPEVTKDQVWLRVVFSYMTCHGSSVLDDVCICMYICVKGEDTIFPIDPYIYNKQPLNPTGDRKTHHNQEQIQTCRGGLCCLFVFIILLRFLNLCLSN